MISFRFDERKATQVAAVILRAAGGKLNYMSLIKLMYIANREALQKWGVPVAPDRYVSMPHGPVLSGVLDSIKKNTAPGASGYWSEVISPPADYDVMLKDEDFDDGELSDREVELLERTYDRFKTMAPFQLRDWCHDNLPEWEDPNKSSRAIPVRSILAAVGFSADQIQEFEREEQEYRTARRLLVG